MIFERLDYTYEKDDVLYDKESSCIIRKIDKSNRFYLDEKIKKDLISIGLAQYEIISHENIEYISIKPFFFPNDVAVWSAEMFKDYCCFYRKFEQSLSKLGLCLIDGHPWNTVFYYSEPKFVDFGSIIKSKAYPNREYKKYEKIYYIYKYSEARRVRTMLEKQIKHPSGYNFFSDLFGKEKFISYKNKIKRITGLNYNTKWTNYYAPNCKGQYADVPKENIIKKILDTYKPNTVYDIGCNKGHYALLCESYGCGVIACDPDPPCIDYLYMDIKKKQKKILPMVADIVSFCNTINRHYKSLRPKSVDLILLLALVHHLVYHYGKNFNEIFNLINRLNPKLVLVEFVSKKDENVLNWDKKNYKAWYNIEELISSGKKFFSQYYIFSSHDIIRPIVLFKK